MCPFSPPSQVQSFPTAQRLPSASPVRPCGTPAEPACSARRVQHLAGVHRGEAAERSIAPYSARAATELSGATLLLPGMSRHGDQRFSGPRVILVTRPTAAGEIGRVMAGTATARQTPHRPRWGLLPRHGARDCLIDSGGSACGRPGAARAAWNRVLSPPEHIMGQEAGRRGE
jgi:hypothetical protein